MNSSSEYHPAKTYPFAAVALSVRTLPGAYTPVPDALQPFVVLKTFSTTSPGLCTTNLRLAVAFAFPAVVTVAVAV